METKQKTTPSLHSTFILKKLSALLMYSGKKRLVFKQILRGLEVSNQELVMKNICVFTYIFHRFKPLLETRKVRKGSKNYEVPFFIKKPRALSLLLRWLARSIRKQTHLQTCNKHLRVTVQNELLEMTNGTGTTVKESKALHKKVSANIIYSHFRWK